MRGEGSGQGNNIPVCLGCQHNFPPSVCPPWSNNDRNWTMHPSSSYSEYSKFNILLSHLLGKEGVNIERQILITFLMHDSSKSYWMELYFINAVTNIYLCGPFFSSMLHLFTEWNLFWANFRNSRLSICKVPPSVCLLSPRLTYNRIVVNINYMLGQTREKWFNEFCFSD